MNMVRTNFGFNNSCSFPSASFPKYSSYFRPKTPFCNISGRWYFRVPYCVRYYMHVHKKTPLLFIRQLPDRRFCSDKGFFHTLRTRRKKIQEKEKEKKEEKKKGRKGGEATKKVEKRKKQRKKRKREAEKRKRWK